MMNKLKKECHICKGKGSNLVSISEAYYKELECSECGGKGKIPTSLYTFIKIAIAVVVSSLIISVGVFYLDVITTWFMSMNYFWRIFLSTFSFISIMTLFVFLWDKHRYKWWI